MNTLFLLDAYKNRYGKPSDYSVSVDFGLNNQTVRNWRTKGGTMSEETALLFADKLDLNPLEVLAAINAERTNCPAVKEAWERAAALLHNAVAA